MAYFKEEIKRISNVVTDAMDKKKFRPSQTADALGISRPDFTKFTKGSRGLSAKKLIKLFRFLSITESELKSQGVSEGTIHTIFGLEKQELIAVGITKVEGAWIYKALTKEIFFAQGSPRAIIKKMILEDISSRLELFFDQNLI